MKLSLFEKMMKHIDRARYNKTLCGVLGVEYKWYQSKKKLLEQFDNDKKYNNLILIDKNDFEFFFNYHGIKEFGVIPHPHSTVTCIIFEEENRSKLSFDELSDIMESKKPSLRKFVYSTYEKGGKYGDE